MEKNLIIKKKSLKGEDVYKTFSIKKKDESAKSFGAPPTILYPLKRLKNVVVVFNSEKILFLKKRLSGCCL